MSRVLLTITSILNKQKLKRKNPPLNTVDLGRTFFTTDKVYLILYNSYQWPGSAYKNSLSFFRIFSTSWCVILLNNCLWYMEKHKILYITVHDLNPWLIILQLILRMRRIMCKHNWNTHAVSSPLLGKICWELWCLVVPCSPENLVILFPLLQIQLL